ncbi:MAG: ribbon-helix-helix domain-containing protein [Bifidobacteriaceae bacterium]|jgi:hypothetical protein|nr:ribbon-helix-helix domain-containing protein [Bifidobacteriaceae bacterium]
MRARMTREQAAAALATKSEADFPTADPADEVDGPGAAHVVAAGRRAAGRPPLGANSGHSPQITLRLPADTHRRLTEAARLTGRRRSQVVRDALDQYLQTGT